MLAHFVLCFEKTRKPLQMLSSWRELNVAAYGVNTLVTYSIGAGFLGRHIGAKSNREVSESHRVSSLETAPCRQFTVVQKSLRSKMVVHGLPNGVLQCPLLRLGERIVLHGNPQQSTRFRNRSRRMEPPM